MAWVIGQSDDREVEAIKEAGYVVDEDLNTSDFVSPANLEPGDRAIAVFVDCDVSELLDMLGGR